MCVCKTRAQQLSPLSAQKKAVDASLAQRRSGARCHRSARLFRLSADETQPEPHSSRNSPSSSSSTSTSSFSSSVSIHSIHKTPQPLPCVHQAGTSHGTHR
ncbi:hypothetical protein NQD34_011542 [Periophthalmus magnuspinnatus]|nr:hypothetical protein NQD34_011542 [Periophthalmus magnuspinnatus]